MPLPTPRLRDLRTAHHETREQVGLLVNRSAGTIRRWETGGLTIPDEARLRLAEHYGVTVDHLMRYPDIPGAPVPPVERLAMAVRPHLNALRDPNVSERARWGAQINVLQALTDATSVDLAELAHYLDAGQYRRLITVYGNAALLVTGALPDEEPEPVA